jgi:hypothetical protein
MKAPDELHDGRCKPDGGRNDTDVNGQTASILPLMRLASKVLLGVE